MGEELFVCLASLNRAAKQGPFQPAAAYQGRSGPARRLNSSQVFRGALGKTETNSVQQLSSCRKPTMAYEEAGPSFPLTAIKKKACGVSEWGQVMV